MGGVAAVRGALAIALLQAFQGVDLHILDLPLVGAVQGQGDRVDGGHIVQLHHKFAPAVAAHVPVILQFWVRDAVGALQPEAGAVEIGGQGGQGVVGGGVPVSGGVSITEGEGNGVGGSRCLNVGGFDPDQVLVGVVSVLGSARLQPAVLQGGGDAAAAVELLALRGGGGEAVGGGQAGLEHAGQLFRVVFAVEIGAGNPLVEADVFDGDGVASGVHRARVAGGEAGGSRAVGQLDADQAFILGQPDGQGHVLVLLEDAGDPGLPASAGQLALVFL